MSESFYKHCKLFPIYGSGQGSGNSQALWCLISSVLFDLYEKKAHGATYYSPDLTISVRIFLIGFVDDKSGSTNDFLLKQAAPPEHYISLATHDAQCWNDLLKLSGGALEDSKCSYHVLYYDFTINGLPILRGTVVPLIKIKFNNATTATPLKSKSAYNAHKILALIRNQQGPKMQHGKQSSSRIKGTQISLREIPSIESMFGLITMQSISQVSASRFHQVICQKVSANNYKHK